MERFLATLGHSGQIFGCLALQYGTEVVYSMSCFGISVNLERSFCDPDIWNSRELLKVNPQQESF